MVESTAKQYKERFCGAGMRWSRSGAERLIPARSAILSMRFASYGTWPTIHPKTEMHPSTGCQMYFIE